MHMIEGWGSGIPDMFMEAQLYGLPEPLLEDLGGDFRVNLYRRTLDVDQNGVVNPKVSLINATKETENATKETGNKTKEKKEKNECDINSSVYCYGY